MIPFSIHKQIAESNLKGLYEIHAAGTCSSCLKYNSQLYKTGPFSKKCSSCIEEEILFEFRMFIETYLIWKSKKR